MQDDELPPVFPPDDATPTHQDAGGREVYVVMLDQPTARRALRDSLCEARVICCPSRRTATASHNIAFHRDIRLPDFQFVVQPQAVVALPAEEVRLHGTIDGRSASIENQGADLLIRVD